MNELRFYHVVAINEKTDEVTPMTRHPLCHADACENLKRFTVHPGRRVQLKEVPSWTWSEYQREAAWLQRAVTVARRRALEPQTLADKLKAQEKTKAAEEAFMQHRLNRFLFVKEGF